MFVLAEMFKSSSKTNRGVASAPLGLQISTEILCRNSSRLYQNQKVVQSDTNERQCQCIKWTINGKLEQYTENVSFKTRGGLSVPAFQILNFIHFYSLKTSIKSIILAWALPPADGFSMARFRGSEPRGSQRYFWRTLCFEYAFSRRARWKDTPTQAGEKPERTSGKTWEAECSTLTDFLTARLWSRAKNPESAWLRKPTCFSFPEHTHALTKCSDSEDRISRSH